MAEALAEALALKTRELQETISPAAEIQRIYKTQIAELAITPSTQPKKIRILENNLHALENRIIDAVVRAFAADVARRIFTAIAARSDEPLDFLLNETIEHIEGMSEELDEIPSTLRTGAVKMSASQKKELRAEARVEAIGILRRLKGFDGQGTTSGDNAGIESGSQGTHLRHFKNN